MFNSLMPSLNIRSLPFVVFMGGSLPFVVFMGGFPSSGAIRPGGLLFIKKQRQLCCRRWLSNKPEAVISRTNLAKSPDYSYYNILGQLCKHVLSRLIKGITEYSVTNFQSRTLNLSKLACYCSYIPARLIVAMQRHIFSIDLTLKL